MPASDPLITDDARPLVPLIRTKLRPPSLPGDLITRHRLSALLDRSLQVPLTVISAPAGYGKTVLASTWARGLTRSPAWLSLDARESDLRQFVCYLCEAVEGTCPDSMTATRDLLSAAELAPVDVVAANLINDLDGIAGPLTVILDDYHRLRTDSVVSEMLSGILQHPPSSLHLVILTRRDPPLAMNRLRAGDRLHEIRLRDLRFNLDETMEFVRAATTTPLSQAAMRHLDDELEGWPVGLRLVALMLKRAQDPEATVAGLKGGLPESQEYMLREVLAGLPAEIRACLMKASILNRFTIETVDAVCHSGETGVTDPKGRFLIAEIRRQNLFAYSLDARRRWYRFHHWFQHVLQRQLGNELDAEAVRELHSRAGSWFDANEEPEEALQHFLAAGQPGKAAELVSRRYLAEIEMDRWYAVDQWLQQVPDEILQSRIELQLAQAWVGICKLDFEAVAACHERIEGLEKPEATARSLMAQLNYLRGWLQYWSGDLETARREFASAMDGFAKSPGRIAGELRQYYAFALCTGGDYPGAIRFLAEQRVASGSDVGPPFVKRLFGAQCFVAYIAGDIDTAVQATDRIRTIDETGGTRYEQTWTNYFSALQCYSRVELDRAVGYLQLCEQHLNVLERRVAADVLGATALAHLLDGNTETANEARQKLERFVQTYRLQECAWLVEAVDASRNLWSGDTRVALHWARNAILPQVSALEMHMWVINPEVTQARVLVTAGDSPDVERGLSMLDGLSMRYRVYHNQCQLFDVDVLRAVALTRLGEELKARETLSTVTRAAAPGGWVRPFVEAGEVMETMLSEAKPCNADAAFVRHLLRTSRQLRTGRIYAAQAAVLPGPGRRLSGASAENGADIEDLTDREMDILQFLEQRLQNKEIAARLSISPHTVGYHLKHIYQKLGVHDRRQAVRKARASRLIAPTVHDAFGARHLDLD